MISVVIDDENGDMGCDLEVEVDGEVDLDGLGMDDEEGAFRSEEEEVCEMWEGIFG
jgi:hypothetical protein